jgi:hypothetical protein
VYVEWSNEVWNGAPGFLPHQWVMQQLSLPQNAGVSFYQFVARQETHTFDIWSQVFAGQSGRLVRTVGVFEASPAYAVNLLAAMNGDFDAIAPAAYFGPTSAQIASYGAATTVDQVINDTAASIPTWLGFLQQHRQIADRYSAALGRPIQLLSYEGGLALEGHNQPYQAVFVAAGQDPRAYDLYRQYLVGARQIGLNLFMQFEFTDRANNNPYGVYGTLTRMDQPLAQAPKYRALLDAVSGALYASPSQPGVSAQMTTITTPVQFGSLDLPQLATSLPPGKRKILPAIDAGAEGPWAS